MSRLIDAAGIRKRHLSTVGGDTFGRHPPTKNAGCAKLQARTGLAVPFADVSLLCVAAKHVPERTPKRWNLISTLVSDCTEGKHSPEVILSDKGKNRSFSQSADDFKSVYDIICTQYPDMLEAADEKVMHQLGSYADTSALKQLILLPPVKECCGATTIVRNRPSFPLVYTTRGTFVAAAFSAECRHCTKKYHLSYYEEMSQESKQRFYYSTKNAIYFQVTSQTIFEIALLEDITNNISISAASFESRAQVYNENFRKVDQDRLQELTAFGRNSTDEEHPWRLTEKRVEDAWFLYSLVLFYEQRGQLKGIDFATERGASQRCDLDGLCRECWEIISASTNPWIHHKCDTVGCSEGYCSLDGVEKVHRAMCAAPKVRIVGGSTPETCVLNVINCCPESPVMGGKHQQPSRFCHLHMPAAQLAEHQAVNPSIFPPEHRYFLRQRNEVTLPDNDDSSLLIGCKKSCNVDRFYDRTAGLLALVRPCGIIVNFSEMFTCESPTQAYVFIYTTFGRSVTDLTRLKYLGYDRACDLHPFLMNLSKRGSMGAKILLGHVKFMVDLWHCEKHKESTCMPPENPNCRYHPHLPQFAEVKGVNTECAEQAFKWLGKYKYITRKMTRHRYCFFIWKMIEEHNKRVERSVYLKK